MPPLSTPNALSMRGSHPDPPTGGDSTGQAVATSTGTTPSAPLRRAVYVRVSDLTASYNIDPKKLQEEIAKAANPVSESEREAAPKGEKKSGSEAGGASNLADKENDVGREGLSRMRIGSTDAEESAGIVERIQQQQHKRLHPPRGGFNLCVLVGNVNVVVDKLRVDRSRVRLAEVEVGDETGMVSLRARDGQIDLLREISERSGAVVLRNCTLELYQGRHLRLAVTKWGKMSTYPDQVASTPPPPLSMNKELNYSLVDLSLVARDIMNTPPPSAEGPQHAQQWQSPSIQSHPDDSPLTRTTSSGHRQKQQQQQHVGSHQQHRKGGRDRRQQQQYRHGHKMGQPRMAYRDSSVVSPMATTVFPPVASFAPLYTDLGMTHYTYPSSPHQRPREGQRSHHHVTQQQHPDQHLDLQHRLFLQHYELQQRQIQQMQMYQEQQERHRRMFERHRQHPHHIQQQQPSILIPDILQSSSVDSADYSVPSLPGGSDQHPSVMHHLGTNPVLVPVSMATSSSMGGPPTMTPASSHKEPQYTQDHLRVDPTSGGDADYRGESVPRLGHSHQEGASPDDGRLHQHHVMKQTSESFQGSTSGRKTRGMGSHGTALTASSQRQQGSMLTGSGGMSADKEGLMSQQPEHMMDAWREQQPGRAHSLQTARVDSPPESPAMIHASHHQIPSSPYHSYMPYDPQAAAGAIYGSPSGTHQQALYAQGMMYLPTVQRTARGDLSNLPVTHIDPGGRHDATQTPTQSETKSTGSGAGSDSGSEKPAGTSGRGQDMKTSVDQRSASLPKAGGGNTALDK